LLWKREAPIVDADALRQHVPDYRQYDRDVTEMKAERQADSGTLWSILVQQNADKFPEVPSSDNKAEPSAPAGPSTPDEQSEVPLSRVEAPVKQIEGPWILPKNLWIILRYRIPRALTYGLTGKYNMS